MLSSIDFPVQTIQIKLISSPPGLVDAEEPQVTRPPGPTDTTDKEHFMNLLFFMHNLLTQINKPNKTMLCPTTALQYQYIMTLHLSWEINRAQHPSCIYCNPCLMSCIGSAD